MINSKSPACSFSLVPDYNKTTKAAPQNLGRENKGFKTDSDRREKVAKRKILFKMAVPSTSLTPSPTTAPSTVTPTEGANLLAVVASVKLGVLRKLHLYKSKCIYGLWCCVVLCCAVYLLMCVFCVLCTWK